MLEGDWDTCVQMAKDQVKEGAHVLDVCVDYVGRDGTADMDEIAQRFATQSSVPARARLHRARGAWRPASQWLGGRAILNSANLEDGEAEGCRFDRVFKLAKEYGAAVICLLIDEEGQARDVEWKMRIAHRIHDLAVDRYGLEPSDLIFDALTFPLSTGDDDLRRDAIATIEAIRRIKDELPGVYTTLGVSNVSLRPQAGGPPRPQLGVPARVRRGRPRLGHRARGQDHARSTGSPRSSARSRLDLIYDRRGRRRLRPAHRAARGLRRRQRRRGRARGPHRLDRRAAPVSQRIIDGDRDGLEDDLDAAMADGLAPLAIINDVLLAGMKVVGELFATGEMQLPVRAAVGRDHEGRGRLPRAVHGEGRRRRQGPHRARHRQGRRARHRQEPGRHHPHQQRLRGAQPRHQDLDRRDDREGRSRSRPTPSA